MESKKQVAAERKRSGKYNCAQAITSTYCSMCKTDETTALNVGNAFAGGMGNMEGTCGALIGVGIVLGLINKDPIQTSKDMRYVMQKFHEKNQATQCKILKGKTTGKVLRECPDCVADAAELLEEILAKKQS